MLQLSVHVYQAPQMSHQYQATERRKFRRYIILSLVLESLRVMPLSPERGIYEFENNER